MSELPEPPAGHRWLRLAVPVPIRERYDARTIADVVRAVGDAARQMLSPDASRKEASGG